MEIGRVIYALFCRSLMEHSDSFYPESKRLRWGRLRANKWQKGEKKQ